jgi:hypothetical protein
MINRVYVAGSYSAGTAIEVLDNIRRGTRAGVELLLAGYSPFVPWIDHQFQFYLREGEVLSVEDYYRYSLAWLEVADALFVLPNSENSRGTQAEIARAKELGIPIFYKFEDGKLIE